MPTLFKRSNGIFYYVQFDDSGRRRWISTGQKSKHLALEQLRQSDPSESKRTPRCTLTEFKRDFLSHAKAVYSPGTVEIYYRGLSHFISHCGNVNLSSVNSRQVDSYTAHRLTNVSPVTVCLELRSLRAAFYTALKWDLIEKNPFKGVKLPRVEEGIPKFFSRADLKKLLDAIPEPWFKAMVAFAVLTGLRRTEISTLQWTDVDFEHRLIQIHSQGTFRTKTGKRRMVPLNAAAIEILRQLSLHRNVGLVFSPNGSPVNPHNISRSFQRYVRRARLEGKATFHCLRHTFATWLVQDGVSIYHVQRLLGHSSIRVTEMYSHLVSDDLHRSVSRIQLELR